VSIGQGSEGMLERRDSSIPPTAITNNLLLIALLLAGGKD